MAYDIGPKIGIEGEAQFRQAIHQINTNLRTLKTEMQAVSSSFAKGEKSQESLTARNQVLNKQIEEQKKKLAELNLGLSKATEKYGESSRVTQGWQQAVNKATAELNSMERELKDNTIAIKDLNNEAKTEWLDKFKNSLKNIGDVAGKTLATGLKATTAAIAALGTAAAAAATKLSKEVISAYADYEQLVGGIDTLFKESSGKLQEYATNAYKTAGMSANEYMETVTGFSASLISSLGGDTNKAVDYANRAVTDMSDNANKMGTDIASIQAAYQGFAKQNYTMLDNLKLGYGGTKTEMERLLKDASAISGIKYDISSFADITEAIHVIQTEMGITGTTFEEAEDTISGSLNTLKGSFQNLMVGFGDANADVTALAKNVVDSFANVAKNITPVLQNIVDALPDVLDGILDAVDELLPSLLKVIVDMVPSLVNTLSATVTKLVNTIVTMLPKLMPTLLAAAQNLLLGIINAIASNVKPLADMMVRMVTSIAGFLVENLPIIIAAALQIVVALAQGISDGIPELIPVIVDALLMIVQTLIDNLPIIIDTGLEIMVALIEGIVDAIPELIKQLPKIITAIVDTLMSKIDKIIEAGIDILMALIEGLPEIMVELTKAMPQIITAIVNGLLSGVGRLAEVGLRLIEGLWEGIKSAADWLWKKVTGFLDDLLGGILGFFGIASPSKVFAEIGENMALGLGVGFGKQMKNVAKSMTASVPTSFGIDANMQGTGGRAGHVTSQLIYNFYSPKALTMREIKQEMQASQQRAVLMGV